MTRLPSDRVESMAITQFRGILDEMTLNVPLRYDIKEGDRGPIWDGNVDFYERDKRKIKYSIDFQVKGRSIGNKRFMDGFSFNEIKEWQLENYKAKNGTILIVCLFRNGYTEKKLYYASLMPYEIDKILDKQHRSKKKNPSIKVQSIENIPTFYRICEQFNYDKKMQGGLSSNFFDNPIYQAKYGKSIEFRSYGNSVFDAINNLLDKDNYFYTLDELGHTVNVSRGKMMSVEMLNSAVVKDSSGRIIFSNGNISELNSEHEELFRFGNSFSINLTRNELTIRLRGSFRSRLRELTYLQDVIKTGKVYINDSSLSLDFDPKIADYFTEAYGVYSNTVGALEKHSIDTDIIIDNWSEDDLNVLGKWLNAVENRKPISLSDNIFGCVQIGTLKLSTFSIKREDGLYDIKSIWNNDNSWDGEFRCNFNNGSYIDTKNAFLVLPSIVFLADDINLDDARNSIRWDELSDGEYGLANLQALNVIKAYDENNNDELLLYADWLLNNLIKYDKSNHDIYFINKQQIKKRLGMMEETDFEEIIAIKDKTSVPMAKLCCCLLLDSKVEARKIFRDLSKKEQEDFCAYPISKFMQDN